MGLSELLRRLNNLVQVGRICQVDGQKALVKADVLGRETPWLPLISQASFFLRAFIPPQVGEQVLVLCPMGDADFGFALRGIFFKGLREPAESGRHKAVWRSEDGSVMIYDTVKQALNTLLMPNALLEFAKNLTLTIKGQMSMSGQGLHLQFRQAQWDFNQLSLQCAAWLAKVKGSFELKVGGGFKILAGSATLGIAAGFAQIIGGSRTSTVGGADEEIIAKKSTQAVGKLLQVLVGNLKIKTLLGHVVIESGALIEIKNATASLLDLNEALLDLLQDFKVVNGAVGISITDASSIAQIQALKLRYQLLLK